MIPLSGTKCKILDPIRLPPFKKEGWDGFNFSYIVLNYETRIPPPLDKGRIEVE